VNKTMYLFGRMHFASNFCHWTVLYKYSILALWSLTFFFFLSCATSTEQTTSILLYWPAVRRGRSPRPTVAAIGVVYQDRLLDQRQALLRPGGKIILSVLI
jgi:hypothetical protein